MKKIKVVFTILMLAVSTCFYAQKYSTKIGVIRFEASVPSFEEVAGENKTASAILEPVTGNIAVLALMKGFRFKVALMEEHFNENYVESDKYPKATFKGKVDGLDVAKLTTDAKPYTITGDLTLHGKTVKVTDSAKISKSGNTITITGSFQVQPKDFAIEIPSVVSKKVADKIDVAYKLQLTN